MTRHEKQKKSPSKVATLLGEIDEIFIKHGLPKPEWAEPDPTRHRIIVRMARQKQAEK